MFDRFYRVEQARDGTTGGAGLGLAISRKAAGRVGGRLAMTSPVGIGSEFRLTLPLTAEVTEPLRDDRVATTPERAESSGPI